MPTTNPALPQPVSPSNNAVIAQNTAGIGCTLLPGNGASAGLGFQIQFHWTPPASMASVASYEIVATNVSAHPLFDRTVTGTDFTETQCNAFVSADLQGWQWRVRAQDAQGQFTDWSQWATFQFSPCVLSDGTFCKAAA